MPRITEGTPVQYRTVPMGPWFMGAYVDKFNGKHRVRGNRGKDPFLTVARSVRLQDKEQSEETPLRPAARPLTSATMQGAPRPVPKPRPPLRLEAYLARVRQMECCMCHAPPPSDPHHYGPRGVGQKTDDVRVVPLCRGCHEALHGSPLTPGMREILLGVQVDLLIAWIKGEG